MDRYYLISPSTAYAAKKIWKGSDADGCKAVLKDQPIAPTEWQIGKTKVFIRSPESLFLLEDLRINYWNNMVNRIKFSFRTWKGFKSVCANRIKYAFLAWKKYREECTLVIQKSYRDYKQVLPPDLRKNNENRIQGRKKRRRLSLTSVRRYHGDYLDVKSNSLLMGVLGPGAQEKVLFSYKGKVVIHPGLLKKKKLSPRTIIVSENQIYLILYSKVKGEIVTKLDTSIPLISITGASFSTLADDFIVIHAEEGDYAVECPFKTEMLAHICSKNQNVGNNLQYMDVIKYLVKKKKAEKIKFFESNEPEHKEGLYKNGKFYTPPGLPSDSRVTELIKKKGELILNNRVLPNPGGGGNKNPNTGPPRTLPTNPPPTGNTNTGPPRTLPTNPPPTGNTNPPPTVNTNTGPPRNLPTPNTPNRPPTTQPPKQKQPQCKAMYNYTAQDDDELTIRKGDVITIIKEHSEWWEGELNGRVGVFPANYVQKVED